MTADTAKLNAAVEVFEVDIYINNNHEANSLVTKLHKHGFLKQENYTWSIDEKHRAKRIHATYIVYIRKNKKQAFKAMITQTNNNTSSRIKYRQITNLL